MSTTITVINRTGGTVWVGIDPYDSAMSPRWSYGATANAQMSTGASRNFTVSGVGPFKVGFATVYNGYPNGHLNPGIECLVFSNVFPGAMLTLATKVEAA